MISEDIWVELEVEANASGALESRRRIYPQSKADLWLVLMAPTLARTLRVKVGDGAQEFGDLPTGVGIDTRLVSVHPDGEALEVSLTNSNYADLFNSFADDIAGAAAAAPKPEQVAARVAARVRRWQAFLRESLDGLSREKQRGLFGELFVLDSVIPRLEQFSAVSGWVGPDKAPQDFNLGNLAVEVKTSAAKKPQSIRISSERQLDDGPVDAIFLWHLSVDERVGAGITLPTTVEKLRATLVGSPSALVFDDLLLSSGYHDAHADLYSTGYSIRQSSVFEIGEGFPRLIESDCPPGLGDVHYSLEIGALDPYRVTVEELLDRLSPQGGTNE